MHLATGMGTLPWAQIVAALARVGYDGGLAAKFLPPVDRTPRAAVSGQGEDRSDEPTAEDEQFIRQHGSGLVTEAYCISLCRGAAQTLLPLLVEALRPERGHQRACTCSRTSWSCTASSLRSRSTSSRAGRGSGVGPHLGGGANADVVRHAAGRLAHGERLAGAAVRAVVVHGEPPTPAVPGAVQLREVEPVDAELLRLRSVHAQSSSSYAAGTSGSVRRPLLVATVRPEPASSGPTSHPCDRPATPATDRRAATSPAPRQRPAHHTYPPSLLTAQSGGPAGPD